VNTRGATGIVYRAPLRDRNGDPVDENGKPVRVGAAGTKVGTITGIIMGGGSASPSLAQQDSSNTTGQIGIPNRHNAIQVQFNDQILIDGVTYRVISNRLWTQANTMTGTKPKYTWVEVEGTVAQL
jgi:hypothetical protein